MRFFQQHLLLAVVCTVAYSQCLDKGVSTLFETHGTTKQVQYVGNWEGCNPGDRIKLYDANGTSHCQIVTQPVTGGVAYGSWWIPAAKFIGGQNWHHDYHYESGSHSSRDGCHIGRGMSTSVENAGGEGPYSSSVTVKFDGVVDAHEDPPSMPCCGWYCSKLSLKMSASPENPWTLIDCYRMTASESRENTDVHPHGCTFTFKHSVETGRISCSVRGLNLWFYLEDVCTSCAVEVTKKGPASELELSASMAQQLADSYVKGRNSYPAFCKDKGDCTTELSLLLVNMTGIPGMGVWPGYQQSVTMTSPWKPWKPENCSSVVRAHNISQCGERSETVAPFWDGKDCLEPPVRFTPYSLEIELKDVKGFRLEWEPNATRSCAGPSAPTDPNVPSTRPDSHPLGTIGAVLHHTGWMSMPSSAFINAMSALGFRTKDMPSLAKFATDLAIGAAVVGVTGLITWVMCQTGLCWCPVRH